MSSSLEVEAIIKWIMVPNIRKVGSCKVSACTHNIAVSMVGREGLETRSSADCALRAASAYQKNNATLILRVCADAPSASVEGHLSKGKTRSSDSSPSPRQRHSNNPPVTSASIRAVRRSSLQDFALTSLKSALRYHAELTLGSQDNCEIDIIFPQPVR